MARGGGMIGLAGVGISVLALAIVFMLAPTKRDKVLKEEKGFFRALNRREHGLRNALASGDKTREDSFFRVSKRVECELQHRSHYRSRYLANSFPVPDTGVWARVFSKTKSMLHHAVDGLTSCHEDVNT